MGNIVQTKFGHCEYSFEKDDIGDYVHIYNLFVLPEFRRQGKAKEFIRKAIEQIRNTGWTDDILIVAKPSENSISKKNLIKFYKKMGLKVFDCYL